MPTEAPAREYSPATKEMGDKIVQLTLMQAKELSDYLENVHGIKAAAGGVMMAGPAASPAAAEKPAEKTSSSPWSWKASVTRRSA